MLLSPCRIRPMSALGVEVRVDEDWWPRPATCRGGSPATLDPLDRPCDMRDIARGQPSTPPFAPNHP